jgi:hypothetical protein
MSGLYTALFGESPNAQTLLDWLGLRRRNLARYRDCYKTEDNLIAIYTRLGGENRSNYESVIQALRRHPLYESDADDKLDATYATFYFRCPADRAAEFVYVQSEQARNRLWEEKLASLESLSDDELSTMAKSVGANTIHLTSTVRRRSKNWPMGENSAEDRLIEIIAWVIALTIVMGGTYFAMTWWADTGFAFP